VTTARNTDPIKKITTKTGETRYHMSTCLPLTEKSARTGSSGLGAAIADTQLATIAVLVAVLRGTRQRRPADNWPLSRANRWSQGDSNP
jgi:hypothetical protein